MVTCWMAVKVELDLILILSTLWGVQVNIFNVTRYTLSFSFKSATTMGKWKKIINPISPSFSKDHGRQRFRSAQQIILHKPCQVLLTVALEHLIDEKRDFDVIYARLRAVWSFSAPWHNTKPRNLSKLEGSVSRRWKRGSEFSAQRFQLQVAPLFSAQTLGNFPFYHWQRRSSSSIMTTPTIRRAPPIGFVGDLEVLKPPLHHDRGQCNVRYAYISHLGFLIILHSQITRSFKILIQSKGLFFPRISLNAL